jgi:hypothetical protein
MSPKPIQKPTSIFLGISEQAHFMFQMRKRVPARTKYHGTQTNAISNQ